MIGAANILSAADDGDMTHLVLLVVFVVASAVIGAMRNKFQKTAEQKRAAEQRRSQPAAQRPAARQSPPPPARPERRQATRQVQHRHVQATARQEQNQLRVQDELRRRQAQRKAREAAQTRRLTTKVPAEADGAAITARLLHVAPAVIAGVTDQGQRRVAVELTNLDQATAAIVYHEVFSAPKALRQEMELWET